jgi:hypothetical protein
LLQKRLQAEQSVLSACKLWLDRLPAGTKLEPVPVTTDGHDLAGIRKRINSANAERDALRRAPAPSEDIEARVRVYLRGLAPKVRGVGAGERLSIVWPGAQAPSGYIAETTCDPLALLAALFPDRMLSLVMTEVERMANHPLPVAQRPPRIAALERELDDLHRVEEVLVAVAIRGWGARAPLAVCAASGGAGRQGSGEGLARRLMQTRGWVHVPGGLVFLRAEPTGGRSWAAYWRNSSIESVKLAEFVKLRPRRAEAVDWMTAVTVADRHSAE